MPKSKKPAGGRPAQNFDPRYAKKKPGGPFRGNEGGPRGPRRDDARPARDGDRFERGSGPRREGGYAPRREGGFAPRDDRRPSYGDRPARDGGRPSYGDRPAREDRRPSYGDRPARDDRRPSYGDRGARDNGRPSYGDRGARDNGRPSYGDRSARDDRRPSFNDRSARDNGRTSYGDRPARDDRRPSAGGARDARSTQRPRFERDERPARFQRDERPARSVAEEQQIDTVHERLEAQAVQAVDSEVTFADLGLGENIVGVLAELGAAKPFPIQAATIAPIIAGRDVLARGRTGSGKTIAFGAPLVERVLRSKAGQKREFGRAPVALIMAPTRELALQIDRTVQPIARSVGLFTTQIYGGVPQGRQVGALKKGVDIIIGTPGRIEDLVDQGKLDLSQIIVSVLDEADHMCELGFLEPVQRILRHTSKGGQKLLFSATLDREVAALVDEFLVEPAVYEVANETQDSGTIDHRVLVIDQRSKGEVLDSLVDREGKTLVFSRTRAYAEQLAEQFEDAGFTAVALHGDLNQAKRTRNIEKFAKGRAQVLVATDVAARGIHVDDVDLVVQADAPTEYKTYLHRSGRTGRAGRSGRVVTLITRMRQRRMAELLERAEIDAPFDQVRPGDDLIAELAGSAPTAAELTA